MRGNDSFCMQVQLKRKGVQRGGVIHTSVVRNCGGGGVGRKKYQVVVKGLRKTEQKRRVKYNVKGDRKGVLCNQTCPGRCQRNNGKEQSVGEKRLKSLGVGGI